MWLVIDGAERQSSTGDLLALVHVGALHLYEIGCHVTDPAYRVCSTIANDMSNFFPYGCRQILVNCTDIPTQDEAAVIVLSPMVFLRHLLKFNQEWVVRQ